MSSESRLQKLLHLLENAIEQEVRDAASHTIRDIAAAHPYQLPFILHKVSSLLRRKNWDCRAIAAETLGLLAQHFCHHTIADLRRLTPNGIQSVTSSPSEGILDELKFFNAEKELKEGRLLVACESRFTAKQTTTSTDVSSQQQRSLSNRELNLLKRKKRSFERTHLTSCESIDSGDTGDIYCRSSPVNSDSDEKIDESILDGRWPFINVFNSLMTDIMHSAWEVRHGAAMGLRELLHWQAANAAIVVQLVEDIPSGWAVSGRSALRDIQSITEANLIENINRRRRCLEKCCVQILRLLVLDRMGDYLTDQMVAPVRETASQAFSCCLSSLPTDTLQHFMSIIHEMSVCNAWEVRHSGFVLLKYLSTTQKERRIHVLDSLVQRVMSGLRDESDDVRAAAADVLVPIASELSTHLSLQQLTSLRHSLWANLDEKDDLSAATPSILHLLWQLYSKATESPHDVGSLEVQLPLLFPFFTNPVAAVRTSAVQCFRQLLHFHQQIHAFFFKAACLLFFNLLTEVKEEILRLNEGTWEILVHAYEAAELDRNFDALLLEKMLELASTPRGAQFKISSLETFVGNIEEPCGEKLTVGSQFGAKPMRMRFAVCRSLALLFRRLPSEHHALLIQLAQSSSATSQMVSTLICHFWHDPSISQPPPLPASCLEAISTLIDPKDEFQELSGYDQKLRKELTVFLNDMTTAGAAYCGSMVGIIDHIPIEEIERFTYRLMGSVNPVASDSVSGSQQQVVSTAQIIAELRKTWHFVIRACVAVVWVDMAVIPPKINLIVQPLMAGVRREADYLLQRLFADRLAQLIIHCHRREKSTEKMIENISIMACQGGTFELFGDLHEICEAKGLNTALGVVQNDLLEFHPVSNRGAESVLQILARDLSVDLFQTLPALWSQMTQDLDRIPPQSLRGLEIIQIISPFLAPELLPQLATVLPKICRLCAIQLHTVRVMVSRCCARLASVHTEKLLPLILEQLIPLLSNHCSVAEREGALILIHHMLESLGVKLVAYIALLIVPLLPLVSDAVPSVRLIAASCFGKLTSLLPLMTPTILPRNLSSDQQHMFEMNREFVAQLMDNKKSVDLTLPEELPVKLREYQREGVCWMMFLRRFGLHGILADDMGLGKTIQTLVSVLLAKRDESDATSLPSLVVCPATLVAHWRHEILTLLPKNALEPLAYVGAQGERFALRQSIEDVDLVVMSYDTLRIDADWVASVLWDYCILDEGHAIRNSESKLWRSCKRLNAKHRLILSGTPVQNGVLELWSLFDFLIPGFLGTKKDFVSQYGKAVHASKYAAKGSIESSTKDLALSSLHKRVMPFIMRRTKDEVLQDLPPKIIQDVFCDLSPIQKALYEDFEKEYKEGETTAPSSFQSFQYLRELCSHPLLAVDWKNPAHQAILHETLGRPMMDEATCQETLGTNEHAPKLQILVELLSECGIIASQSPLTEGASGSHRVLIFAQLKGMLTIVERQVLQPQGIPFLRMDGSVPTHERGSIVHQFNSDPTISVMLLTTKVGGLGLNLTSADVVIFLEHDWNPANDIQAMDRAHRLGQKRTVNVYRILTRGTLEEKIMNYQHFKLGVANSVMNKDNMSLKAMDTSHLLDLFSYGDKEKSMEESKGQDLMDEEYVERYEKEFGETKRRSERIG